MKSLSSWWRPLRALRLGALALGVLLSLPLTTAHALGGESGPASRGPDEGGEIVPSVAAHGSGFQLVGTPRDIRRLVVDVSGQGTIDFRPLDPSASNDLIVISLAGNLAVRMDRAELATGKVAILFRSGTDFGLGRVHIEVGPRRSASFLLDSSQIVHLPLARVYGAGQLRNPSMEMWAMGAGGEFLHAATRASQSNVVLVMRSAGTSNLIR